MTDVEFVAQNIVSSDSVSILKVVLPHRRKIGSVQGFRK